MDRESIERLRFDRRLERRRGWVSAADAQGHLEALPDVSEKMTRGLDESEEEAQAEDPMQNVAGSEPQASSGFEPPSPFGDSTPGGFGGGSELS